MHDLLKTLAITVAVSLLMLAAIPVAWLALHETTAGRDIFTFYFWLYTVFAILGLIGTVRFIWECRDFIRAQLKARRKRRKLIESEFKE